MRSLLLASLSLGSLYAAAEQPLPPQLEGVNVEEKLGAQVDLGLMFTAENGYQAPLEKFFRKDRPVVLNLVYYTCPMLCNQVLNGQTSAMREIPWTPGQEYEIVTVSIDPKDNFDVAGKKKAAYLENFERPAPGWHFLTDYQGNAARLADQVGFRYTYDSVREQYAHAAAIMILTPEGKVSRYLYGIKFKSRDLRLALTEASAGKTGSSLDKLLLFCFHYDPQARSYVLFATNFMRGGGMLVVLILGLVIWRMFRNERRERRRLDGSWGLAR
jgi:protein SCO1/2